MSNIPSFASNPIVFFLWRILILFGMVICFTLLASGVGLLLTKLFLNINLQTSINDILNNPAANPSGVLAVKLNQILISVGTFIIPAYFFSKSLHQNPAHFLRILHPTKYYNYLFGIALIIAAIPVSSWLLELNNNIKFPANFENWEHYLRNAEEVAKKQSEMFIRANTIGQLLFNLLVVAVVPAIVEEVFFRGCLQNFVRMCFYNLHVSVIFTALLFSAAHGEFYAFLPRFLFGIVLGYIFAYSGNIWVGVLAHFLNNAIALIANYLLQKDPSIYFLRDEYTFPFYVTALAILALVIMLYSMSKLRFNQIFINNIHE
ncbi:MAG: CPBP family intramembrane glutamic endopeptidase [Bacteroidota bacterium]